MGLVRGAGAYAHRSCFGRWFAERGLGFCGSSAPMFCAACQHAREAAAWRADFEAGAALVVEAFQQCDALNVVDAERALRKAEASMEIAPTTLEALQASSSNASGTISRSAFVEVLSDAARRMHPQAWIQRVAEEAIRGKLLD